MAVVTEKRDKPQRPKKKQAKVSSWDQIKKLLTCKQIHASTVHLPSKASICSFKDVVHGNTRVVHRPDHSPDLRPRKPLPAFRKLSGCYECHTIVDPTMYPRPTVCCCSQCGEVFTKIQSLELHQAVRHAVSELGPEDSGRNIVEIIFKSSWVNKDCPIFKIERILKVHNTQRTIQRFEDCRDAVKSRRKSPRCAADGNELLRFHCTTLSCSLGARGSSHLCSSVPGCAVCTLIRNGFHAPKQGVRTTASSGRAHASLSSPDGRRAMLVCRVIAGRVRRVANDAPEEDAATSYDSVAGQTNMEELMVYNPKAILACFVVIYKGFDC